MSSWNALWDTVSPLNASVCVCVSVRLQLLCLVRLFLNPMDCSLPKPSVHGIFWPKTGVGCHCFLQGIFLTQGWNLYLPCLLHCRLILYRWTTGELTLRLRMFKDSNLCSINYRSEWNCNLPSISHCWRSFSSTISYFLSLLQAVTLLACSLHASPCVSAVLLYIVLFKVLYCKIKNVFACCLHIICVESIINLLQYSTM